MTDVFGAALELMLSEELDPDRAQAKPEAETLDEQLKVLKVERLTLNASQEARGRVSAAF